MAIKIITVSLATAFLAVGCVAFLMMVIMTDVMTVTIEVMIIVMIKTVAMTGNAGNTNSSVKDWNWNVAKYSAA